MSERVESSGEQQPPARPKSRAERQAETRDNLLSAALEVFIERGFHGASVETIARHAGYTKGAVYANFASKDALFLAVADRRIEQAIRQSIAGSEEQEDGEATEPDYVVDEGDLFEIKWAMLALEVILYAVRESPELHLEIAERYRNIDEAMMNRLQAAGTDTGESLPVTALAHNALHEGLMLRRIADPDYITAQYALSVHQSIFDPPDVGPWRRREGD